ncbi:MFS transporter [Promicromonospora sp. NPDC050262]|uniref:MFS transporter n=1 Tax=Promicromonospora sp. NPDC050262 TaxID=3155036 RepID=UPI00340CA442
MTAAEPTTAEIAAARRRLPLAAVLAAYVVSVTCTAVSAIAIPWFVLTTTGSAAQTGLVVTAEMAPYVLMQATAGPAVERFGPRRSSWTANLAAGVALLVVPVLYVNGHLGFGALLVVIACAGAFRGVADCGSAPLVPAVARLAGVPLERAAGLHASASQGGQLVGAPIAAVLLTVISPPTVLIVSGGAFFVAAMLVALCVPRTVGAPAAGDDVADPYLRRLGAGLAFLARDRVLLGVVVMVAVGNLLNAGLASVYLPSWVREHELPVAAVGTVAGGFSLGALAGSLVGAWVAPRVNRWALYSFGFLLGGAPWFLALAVSDEVVPVLAVVVLCGLAMGGINPVLGAVQYERIPTEMLPRVLGAVKSLAWLGLPLGPLVAGVLVDGVGLVPTLWAVGVAYAVLALTPFVVPSFRLLSSAGREGRSVPR